MILLRILLATGIILGACAPLNAEEPQQQRAGSAVNLERIVVTNKRASGGLDEAAENIVIVTEAEIRELPAKNLGEVLNYIPGVAIQLGKGFGRETAVTIQGCDSRQVRVMIDGIPLNSQSSGQVDPSEFPLENIAKIEIIKGPASSVWGSGLGGVINVITKDTGTTLIPKGSVMSSYAGFDTKKDSVELSGKASDLGYYLFSSYMDSGGKGPESDVLENKAFGKLSYDLKSNGKLIATFGYSAADVNSGRLPDGTWESHPYRDLYGKVGWEKDFGLADIRIDFKHSRKDIITTYFQSADSDVPNPDYLQPRVQTKDILYQLSLTSSLRPRKVDLLVIGADFDNDVFKSNAYLAKAMDLKVYAPYVNYSLKLSPWDINFGLRYDNNSEFGNAFSPSLGAVYHFKDFPDTLVRAGVSRAFNAPPLLWRFSDNAGLNMAANPDIKAEQAWVYEAGLESRLVPRFWFKFSLYRSDVYDAISSARNSLGRAYMTNFQKFRRQGLEFDSKFEVCPGLSFRSGAAFNDVEDRATRETVRGAGKAPRLSFNTGVEYKTKFGLSVSLIGYYNRWSEAVMAESNDRKMLCDLKITQDWKILSLFLNVYNVNNSKYWADYYYPWPQRYFEGGFSINW